MAHRYATDLGGFSDDGFSYEIRSPHTPRPWTNVLVNGSFLAEVSQTGRGESLYMAPSVNTVSLDHRAFYLRDAETKEVWCPTGAPGGAPLLGYRCVHRPDCTVIESERAGIRTRIRVFVPVEGTVSIWTITVRNLTVERRTLSLFTYIPMLVTDRRWPGEFYNAARYREDLGAMIVDAQFMGSPAGLKYVGYLAADPKPDAVEGSEEAFLGGAGRWDRPAAVVAGRLANGVGLRERVCAAFQHDLVLDENGSFTVNMAVGCEETRDEAAVSAARFTGAESVDALYEECWAFWQEHAGSEWLATPDDEINLLMNTWLKRQLVMQVLGRRWTGEINARNTLQDAVGYLPFDAAPCRRELTEAFSRQEPSGFIPRDWPAVPALEPAIVSQRHRDIPVWAAWALAAYVNETGDVAFLAETLPYDGKKKPVSILDHAVAGLRFLSAGVGQHGLCLFGEGDWNDPLEFAGREGRGESVWTSLGLVLAARALEPVARRAGCVGAADELTRMADAMDAVVNDTAWDGDWYIRGYADDRMRFGTRGEPEGRIYLNPQSWAVLAGVARGDRADRCLESVRANLETDCGTAVLAPPYRHERARIGRLTNKVPGTAENGSVYCHAAMFHACALAVAGQGDRAVACFRRLLPTVRQHPVETSRHIPIWMPNYYVPPTCEHGGLASDLYLTGTAPWCFIFIREYVFGVRPGPDGLTVRPCLPADWRECRMVRPFRGDSYDITIRNPAASRTGSVRIEMDGNAIDGETIPLVGDGRRHAVVVTLC